MYSRRNADHPAPLSALTIVNVGKRSNKPPTIISTSGPDAHILVIVEDTENDGGG
jgi:hypothetical protein